MRLNGSYNIFLVMHNVGIDLAELEGESNVATMPFRLILNRDRESFMRIEELIKTNFLLSSFVLRRIKVGET